MYVPQLLDPLLCRWTRRALSFKVLFSKDFKNYGDSFSLNLVLPRVCNSEFLLFISIDGQVFSWGKNSDGQLGLGKEIPSQASPQRVRSLEGIPLAQVAAGGAHSFALSLPGTSFGWGSNRAGQLALSGNNVPGKEIVLYL